MITVEQQLGALIAPGTGEHPIKHLPVPDAPRHSAAVNVGLRVAGLAAHSFNVAFYAKLHRPRPDLMFWGAPQAQIDLAAYTRWPATTAVDRRPNSTFSPKGQRAAGAMWVEAVRQLRY